MLYGSRLLFDFTLWVQEDVLGNLKDLYADELWKISYLVLATMGKQGEIGLLETDGVEVDRTRRRLVLSAELSFQERWRASEQSIFLHEREADSFSAWPYYSRGPGLWGSRYIYSDAEREQAPQEPSERGMERLHSLHRLQGYRVRIQDREIGWIDEVIVDTETWRAHSVVINASSWRRVIMGDLPLDSLLEFGHARRLVMASHLP